MLAGFEKFALLLAAYGRITKGVRRYSFPN